MIKRIVISIYFLLLLVLLSANVSMANENEDFATPNESKHYLKKYLKDNLEIKFKEKDIYQIENLYNVNDELLGYHYKLKNKNNEEYFFILSAQKIYSPVLAAGEGKIEEIDISKNIKSKKYFMGGFTVITADSSTNLLNHLTDLNPKYSKDEIRQGLIVEENIDAPKQWQETTNMDFSEKNDSSQEVFSEYTEELDNTVNEQENLIDSPEDETISIASTSSRIINAPFFNQFDTKVIASRRGSSCGPATQAAILEYWKLYKGKSSIRGTTQFGSKGAYINYMYDNYGGSYLGMSISNVGTGVVSQAQKGGYQATRTTFNNFTSYMTEVKNYRPMAVKFDKKFVWNEPNRNYAYDYHWTVGVGYYYDSVTLQKTLKVHTNGGRYSDGTIIASKVVSIDYPYNSPIISMIKFNVF